MGVGLVRDSALWTPGSLPFITSSSGCERGNAGVWVSCWVSFKANLILNIKVGFFSQECKE